ncbi:MAG: aldehyde ferredoxin oxidoreductase family protein, partial [Promethearchaeota archaeon]
MMEKIGGITGKILRVNLSKKTSSIQETPANLIKKFIGGRGLGAYFLYNEVGPKIQPLSPENKLIFMNGPLSGSFIPGNGRICVTFKSPLTNTYYYSLCGSYWGTELKFAGYDGLIIEGKSEGSELVYLWIKDDHVEIKSAEHLKGKKIPETEKLIRQELGNNKFIQMAVIGPSGENLTKYACITAGQSREFGRGGGGAVMGSKYLKGIVIRGTTDLPSRHLKEVAKLSERYTIQIRKEAEVRRQYGTPFLVKIMNDAGVMCANNYQEGYTKEGYKLHGEQMRKDIVIGDVSCYGCPVGCGKITKIESQKFGEILMEGPEFESISLLGTNCGITDWETIMKATKICDEYGFDSMNAGGCISLAMECFEKGIIGLKETDGINLKFGSKDGLIQVLEKIGNRDGIGDILAEGVVYAAEKFRAPDLAMHSKGQTLSAYDPRGLKSMALTYATSPKGAHHMVATTMGYEIQSGTGLSNKDKGDLQRTHQISMCIQDSISLCSTMRAGLSLEEITKAYSVIT